MGLYSNQLLLELIHRLIRKIGARPARTGASAEVSGEKHKAVTENTMEKGSTGQRESSD